LPGVPATVSTESGTIVRRPAYIRDFTGRYKTQVTGHRLQVTGHFGAAYIDVLVVIKLSNGNS